MGGVWSLLGPCFSLQRSVGRPSLRHLGIPAMAELEVEVQQAHDAAKRMMRLESKDGVKVYTHPLKFKVSDTWLHAKVNIMKKQLSIIRTQVSPEHVATWYLQDLRIIQVMLRAIFSCTIILFSLGCPAMASNLIKYEHSFHHSHNRWMSIYIYIYYITVQQNKYIIHIFELYIYI